MQSTLIQICKALSATFLILFFDLVLVSWCHDRSKSTNKFLVLDYLDYVAAEPAAVADRVHNLEALPAWLDVPGFEILSVTRTGEETARIMLKTDSGERVAGTLQKRDISGRNGDSVSFSVQDESGGFLFEYRLTLQSVSGQTRISHLSASPALRTELIRRSPKATAALRDQMIHTHTQLEGLFRDEQ